MYDAVYHAAGAGGVDGSCTKGLAGAAFLYGFDEATVCSFRQIYIKTR